MNLEGVTSIKKASCGSYYSIHYKSGEYARLSILNDHVFRYYMSPTGDFLDYPIPNNSGDIAKINIKAVEDYDKKYFQQSFIKKHKDRFIVFTKNLEITFDRINGTFSVYNINTGKDVLKEHESIRYNGLSSTQTVFQLETEYFYGGGMQNGRFTHKGEILHIKNTNNYVDGGVTSPNPFYWSTEGYGVLRNTWAPGIYDFGLSDQQVVKTTHNEQHFDAFYFINPRPKDILSDYYELTGRPIYMPEFAFYEAHLNTFNRDYWVEVSPDECLAILFEDGKYYKCYQPNEMNGKTGILESLNGEKENYQFSARAMIDRYKNNDMPLGWFLPNDGYGSGYGQTKSLQGDLQNLGLFIEYANYNGVEVALWTESSLEPEDPNNPKKGERDLSKEVSIGVVALKCDVAWIGAGYSFGLQAVEHATDIVKNTVKNKVRPFIVMVDGWAGTQRYASIWSGDQYGGEWEYIRFHIPTYIGAGLSGIPIVGSDMDGIFGGGDEKVNIREFQWKTFTPLQLNMDGWGSKQKTPFSFEAAKDINRAYLKMKSMLLPYNYTIGYESTQGLPMIRAMFLEFPKEIPAYTKDSQYQFMWGPNILVAPVYEESTVRDGIYLPESVQVWIDFFTGDKYQGGKIYNNINTPLWKIPVFIRDGAIIPLVNANNNPSEVERKRRIFLIYPNGKSSFEVYEDDGKSSEYLENSYAKTKISVDAPECNKSRDLSIKIHKTAGSYQNIIKERSTILQIMASDNVEHVKASINNTHIDIIKVKTKEEFEGKDNVCFFDNKFIVNPYLMNLADKQELYQKFLHIKINKTDVSETEINIKIKGYSNKSDVFGSKSTVIESLKAPKNFTSIDEETTSTSITLQWEINDALYYEIEKDRYSTLSNISGNIYTLKDFKSESKHEFRIRSVGEEGVSKWSDVIAVVTKPVEIVQDITVKCNIPCQQHQEECNLNNTDGNLWHTDWNRPGRADIENGNKITLTFNLNEVYEIRKIEYVPRNDAGNGTFLQIQYRYSINLREWSDTSPVITWEQNQTTKTIDMEGTRFQYFELDVLKSVGGFGSGKNIFFYKKNK